MSSFCLPCSLRSVDLGDARGGGGLILAMANAIEMAWVLFCAQSLVRKSGAWLLFDKEFLGRQRKGRKKEEESLNHHIGMAIKRMELQ